MFISLHLHMNLDLINSTLSFLESTGFLCGLLCLYPNKFSSQASGRKQLPVRVYEDASAQHGMGGGCW